MVGGSIAKASCPSFSRVVTVKTTFTRISNLHRLQQLAKSLGDSHSTQAYKLAASLTYTGQQRLATGGVAVNTWSSQVADAFDNSSLTVEEGVSTTIGMPQSAEFPVASGQQAKCVFVFSTVQLSTPATATVAFLFDRDGATSWVTSMTAQYQASSYSNIDTIVTFSRSGSRAGGHTSASMPACAPAWALPLHPAEWPDGFLLERRLRPTAMWPAPARSYRHVAATGDGWQRYRHWRAAGRWPAQQRVAAAVAGASRCRLLQVLQPEMELLQRLHHQAAQQLHQQVRPGQLHLHEQGGGPGPAAQQAAARPAASACKASIAAAAQAIAAAAQAIAAAAAPKTSSPAAHKAAAPAKAQHRLTCQNA